MQDVVKKNWIHGVALLIFLIFSFAHFYPSLQNKKLNHSDSIVGMSKEILDHYDKTGEVSRWTNAMFGGMPTYYIWGKYNNDAIDFARDASRLFMKNEVGEFFLGMVCFYILLLMFKVSPLISIFGALTFAFATNNLVLLDTGHVTKLRVVLMTPLILAGIVGIFKDKRILGFLLFTIGMSFSIKGDHPQMTYYFGLTLIPLMVIYLIKFVKEKRIKDFAVNSGFLIAGLALAIATTAPKVLSIQEYTSETMRGAPILKKSAVKGSSSAVEGLSYEYAMNWSNGYIDLLQSFIPFSVGGSNNHKLSSDSHFAKEMRKRGANTRNGIGAPMYWGKLPSTAGTIYFGAVAFFLFFISLFYLKSKLKWWLLSGVLLTMLLSLGSNLDFLSRFFYNYVPLYKMFRTPNSVLSVTPVLIALGAFWGLNQMLKNKVDFKKILYPGLALALFCIGYAFLAPSFFDMVSATDARYAQMGLNTDVLIKDRADLAKSSGLKSGFLMLLTLASLWGFFNDKLKKNVVIVIIGALSIFDLVSTNIKYVTPSKYITKANLKKQTEPREVDKQIFQDTDLNYRVMDIPGFASAASSYHHKTVGGYHAAKLVRYNDLIDYHISKNNMNVFNMLNTKYFITQDQSGGESVQRNTAALGNAWFVNTIKTVNSNEKEIESLTDFDPLGTAIVHNEFSSYLIKNNFEKSGSINLTAYEPNELVYSSNSQSDQFAVFSEIWYGPNKGWQAYIDGKPVDHIRVNYVLRGLNIPAGNHEIKFIFDPQSIKIGNLIAMISSILVVASLLFYIINLFRPEDKKWLKIE